MRVIDKYKKDCLGLDLKYPQVKGFIASLQHHWDTVVEPTRKYCRWRQSLFSKRISEPRTTFYLSFPFLPPSGDSVALFTCMIYPIMGPKRGLRDQELKQYTKITFLPLKLNFSAIVFQ